MVAACLIVSRSHFVEEVTLREGVKMGLVSEDEWALGDRDWRVGSSREGRTHVDDIGSAEIQTLRNVLLLTKRARREDLDFVATIRALRDLVCRPQSPFVICLTGLVHVGKFERPLRKSFG